MIRKTFFTALACLLMGVCAASARAQGVTPEMRSQANDFYQRSDWAKAAEAYEAIIKLEPANAGAWARRGLALHSLGKYKEALAAYERSLGVNDQQPVTLFNLARTYARLGDAAKAFESLDRAVEVGFGQPDQFKTDEDLASLRDEARFKQAQARAAVNARPCTARPEYRQLDFWIGDWDVKSTTQGQTAGASSIQLILGDCVIFENWTGASGVSGKSFSFFNARTGRWQQKWVDDKGGLTEFTGDYKDGAMHFTAATTIQGKKALQRMTLFNLSRDQMRQLGEQSADEGKTWTVIYDLTYNRRK